MAVNQVGDGSTDGVNTAYGFAANGKTPPAGTITGTADVTTGAAGSVTAAYVNTTYTGGIGTTAFTVGDIVAALKTIGILTE